MSYKHSKLRFSAKHSFFGQSVSREHYQPTYQPTEGVYSLNNTILETQFISELVKMVERGCNTQLPMYQELVSCLAIRDLRLGTLTLQLTNVSGLN